MQKLIPLIKTALRHLALALKWVGKILRSFLEQAAAFILAVIIVVTTIIGFSAYSTHTNLCENNAPYSDHDVDWAGKRYSEVRLMCEPYLLPPTNEKSLLPTTILLN